MRVVLSRPEERLKLGGRGWESKVMGALHFGRERRDLVVTVSDAAYAAELLASIRAGEVAVLSRGHRATCQYNGSCGKLYGDGDSQDYVACFRMSVSSIAEE